MKRRAFPDLGLRARIAARRENDKQKQEFAEKLEHISEVLKKAVHQIVDAGEDDFVEHLKECPNCRKEVARMVRSGAQLSQRVLAAAGIEILN